MSRIRDLEAKIARQKRELAQKDRTLAARSRQLDAMAWVWCDGGCPGGVLRHTTGDLTEEIVAEAERNAARLRRWFDNAAFRAEWARMTKAERTRWFEDRTEKT